MRTAALSLAAAAAVVLTASAGAAPPSTARCVREWNAPRNLGERAAIAREDATRARVGPATTLRVSWTKQGTKETVEFPSCAFIFIGPKTMFSIAGIWRYDRVAAWQKPIPIDPKWRSTFTGNATVSADGALRLK